jgi:hypothetical protein
MADDAVGTFIPGPENGGLPLNPFRVQRLFLVGNVSGIVESHGPESGGFRGREELYFIQRVRRLSHLMLSENVTLNNPYPVSFHRSVALPFIDAKPGQLHYFSSPFLVFP